MRNVSHGSSFHEGQLERCWYREHVFVDKIVSFLHCVDLSVEPEHAMNGTMSLLQPPLLG